MKNGNKAAAGGAGDKKKARGVHIPRHTVARYIASLQAISFRGSWIMGNQPNISHKFIVRQHSHLELCRAL